MNELPTVAELKHALVWRCFTKRTGRVKLRYVDEYGRRARSDAATHIKARAWFDKSDWRALDELEALVRAVPGCVRTEQQLGPIHNQVIALFVR